jgi:CheY-like chemotaxis protein
MTAELKRILLAEDDPRDVELTLNALEKHKLANQVVVAADGEEALDYLFRRGKFTNRTEGNPAVVLLDLKMPKLDGLEVLAAIRADAQLHATPVVILTSSREQSDLVASYNLGVNAFVVKPVNFQAFVKAVGEIGLFWALMNEPPPDSLNRIT